MAAAHRSESQHRRGLRVRQLWHWPSCSRAGWARRDRVRHGPLIQGKGRLDVPRAPSCRPAGASAGGES
eukprot:390995-Prymnesium_polylepis.1